MTRPLPLILGMMMNATSPTERAPIRYEIQFTEPQTHYVEVVAEVPTEGRDWIELMMPVWTPGSYLVREYARHVEQLRAMAGDRPLAVSKTRKNRWRVETGGASSVRVVYRVYARELSVQGNFVDGSFALLNGAATFLTLADDPGPRPHEVQVRPAQGWAKVVTVLPEAGADPADLRFVAADYDTLVDCPIYAGNAAVYEFTVDGKPHWLVNEGEGGVWDGPRSAADVEAIVKAQRDFWGHLPYERYVFFNLLTETGGGLEHASSTVLMASRWATRKRSSYLNWLFLVSHEFFHTWNVKRLRPVELGPFDYENEVYTRSLWVAEGLTSYYDRLLVRRAGLCSDEEVLAGDPPSGLGDGKPKNDIERLQDTPGRRVQTLAASSYDAWIKFYRRDENSVNSGVSYYVKGAVVGWLLDARIRRLTDGQRSLDDVMRRAYERFSGPRGFTPEEFQAVAAEVAGADLSDFFHRALETTDELDYAEALDLYGLRFRNGETGKEPRAWLGIETKNEDGRLVVSQVRRGTPGAAAGVNVGDEILAIGEFRVRADQWSKRLELYRPEESTSLLIARRERLMRLPVTFGREPTESWRLAVRDDASPEQNARRKAWLQGK
ncbi:MAG: peptidase M61 [Isosphaeraceae bacterium]|jgi:predicted metalloprotease with PDZ domain|nr:MAG: peptidase M61 [Isosphaeraceae bacterium]